MASCIVSVQASRIVRKWVAGVIGAREVERRDTGFCAEVLHGIRSGERATLR
ncbi:MAG: hypothetical protein N2595_07820 [bacterium]|nr:hypothetical protein [bacterium]